MAFRKVGDAAPIVEYYNSDGVEEECPNCGNSLSILILESGENRLICEYCELQENDDDDDDQQIN